MKCFTTATRQVVYLLGLANPSACNLRWSRLLWRNRERGGHGCINRTLKGTYVFTQDGWESRAPSTTQPAAGDRRPFAYAGQEEYDGHGNFTGVNTLVTARNTDQNTPVAVSPFVTYKGTCTVNRDCTVLWSSSDEDGFTSNYNLFLSPDGEKFTFIGVDAQVLVGGCPDDGTGVRRDRRRLPSGALGPQGLTEAAPTGLFRC